jgi:hypothetical protein
MIDIDFLFLADYAFYGENKKVGAIGIFQNYTPNELPKHTRPFYMVIRMIADPGDYKFELFFEDPQKVSKPIAKGNFTIEKNPSQGGSKPIGDVQMLIPPMEVTQAGFHSVLIKFPEYNKEYSASFEVLVKQ